MFFEKGKVLLFQDVCFCFVYLELISPRMLRGSFISSFKYLLKLHLFKIPDYGIHITHPTPITSYRPFSAVYFSITLIFTFYDVIYFTLLTPLLSIECEANDTDILIIIYYYFYYCNPSI